MKNVIEFSQRSNDIVFCVVDNTAKIKHDWTKELIKNLSDYVLSNIAQKGFSVLQGVSEEALLKEASAKYQHAVVISTGTEFINGDRFFKAIKEAVSKEYFLQGHIPDRQEGYYELHDQCYIINLKTYKKLGYPAIGNFAYYDAHEQIEPLRSEENIHDDYTPVWVKPGSTLRKYQHKWHGWNILSVAFKNNLPVLVFDENLRNNKKFYYPDYEPSFQLAQEYLYGKHIVSSQAFFYPFNTEQPRTADVKPIGQLITQASGLNWIDCLVANKYTKGTIVNFVDNNTFALETMKFITEWNGEDYPQMLMDYILSRSSFLGVPIENRLAFMGESLDQLWKDFVSRHSNWNETWNDIKSKVTFKFTHADLVLNRSLPVERWLEDKPNTLIHLSHIFNYDPVAPFVPLMLRVSNENNLIKKVANFMPDAIIVFDARSAEGLYQPLSKHYVSRADQMAFINTCDLTCPTWRYGEWI